MKPRVVKHLSNIEIDEVSLVDRGANQHATVAIAKRAPEEETMPKLFNEEGQLLDENSLEDGQQVYDEDGTAYVFTLDEDEDGDDVEAAEDDNEDEDAETPELAGVGKAFGFAGGVRPNAFNPSGTKKKTAQAGATPAFRAGAGTTTGRPRMAGAASAGGAGGVAKSFSEGVMEELSKAYSDEERDAVLSKAFGAVETFRQAAEESAMIAKSERDLRLTNEYISKAAEYNLPVDAEELGPVLYRMAETMDYDDCRVIAKCLEAAGSALFDEVGYIGGGDNVDIMDQVEAQAQELVGKAAGGVDSADVIGQIFEQNPEAYDEYLASRRGY